MLRLVNKALPLRATPGRAGFRQCPQRGDRRGRANPSCHEGLVCRAHQVGAELVAVPVQLQEDRLHLRQVPHQVRPGNLDFVSGSQAPAWEPYCKQSSCFARKSSIVLHQVAQAGAWERGKSGMRCAFPPYGLRVSAPAAAISSWCLRRTLRKTVPQKTENGKQKTFQSRTPGREAQPRRPKITPGPGAATGQRPPPG